MAEGTKPRRERGTGSLRWKRGRFYIRYSHAGRLHEQATPITDLSAEGRRQAERFLRKRLKLTGTALFVPPSAERLTFEKCADLVLADYQRRERRSRITYRLAHLRQAFGGWRALAITPQAIADYTSARRKAGAAVATVNRELALLRRMLQLAVDAGQLPARPKIALQAEHNARQGFLDPPDLDTALAALRAIEPVIADATEAAFYTCLRRGNVLGLTWPMLTDRVLDGDALAGGTLHIPETLTKNKRPLVLPVTGRLLAIFARRWAERSLVTPHVFHRDGRPVVTFRRAWQAARLATGRADLRFHDLRRSGARTLRRAKVDQLTIMRRGGWLTPSMFMRYAITDEQDQREAQEALDRAMAAPGPRKVTPLRAQRRRRS